MDHKNSVYFQGEQLKRNKCILKTVNKHNSTRHCNKREKTNLDIVGPQQNIIALNVQNIIERKLF